MELTPYLFWNIFITLVLKDDMNTLMDRVEKLHEKVDKLFEVK